MNFGYPDPFARFYDVIYERLRNDVDHAFFLDRIKKAEGKVLEIGVGTGRFFTDALNSGADIYGLDISPSMINILKKKLTGDQAYRISLQNITDFSYDFAFDLIIAPFRVMMHLIDKEEQIQALNNVHRHLIPGGTFIFDAFVPDLDQLIRGLDNYTDFEGEYEPGKKLKRTVSTRPALIDQLINVSFHLEWDEEEGSKSEDWSLPLRFYFRYELEHLVERSDFKRYDIYGNYQGNKLCKESKEFILVCQKNK